MPDARTIRTHLESLVEGAVRAAIAAGDLPDVAVPGDALARALGAAGYETEREYYVNDAGTQTDTFGETLYARYQQLLGRTVSIPADGYPGQYMVELAEKVRDREGDRFLQSEGEPPPA